MNYQFDRSKLRSLREAQEISQEHLAIKLEVSCRALVRWEAGHAVPSLSQYFKLKEYFGEDLYTSVEETKEPNQPQITTQIPEHQQGE